MAKCQHDIERTRCRTCGGGSICLHDKVRSQCPICSTESAFRRYERQAKERNLSWSITQAEFDKLVSGPCALCGKQPALGIDRIDSRISYNTRNVQSFCAWDNKIKSTSDYRALLEHLRQIHKYQELLKQKARLNVTSPGPEEVVTTHTAVQGAP